MNRCLTLAVLALLASDADAAVTLKRGVYATSRDGCTALNRQDPDGKLDLDGIVSEVRDTDASFLIIDKKTVGSIDFECSIGKPKRKGKVTEWPLTCAGESSGGDKSTMRSEKAGTLTFSGGLEAWGTTYFCR